MPKQIRSLDIPEHKLETQSLPARQRTMHRRAFVMQHTIAGFSTDQITRLYNKSIQDKFPEFQVSETTIKEDRKYNMSDLKRRHAHNVEEWRGLLLERYEMLARTLYPRVRAGDYGGIDRYLKVLDQIGAVTGANAPIKMEIQHSTLSEEERRARVMEFLEMARERAEEGSIIDVDDLPLLEAPEELDGSSDSE